MPPPRIAALTLACTLLACAGGGDVPVDAGIAAAAAPPPEGSGRIEEFLPSVTLASGEKASVHVTPDQMPWRIDVPLPKDAPQHASRRQGQEAVISALREWERALRTELPWFHLEFVEDDPEAPVRVVWKRRTVGPWSGFGAPRARVRDGEVEAGGELVLAVRSCELCPTLDLDEVRLLAAHEFGHVLGLGHCHTCESAMNYDWQTRGRAFVTRVDVRAFVALCAQPNPAVDELAAER